MLQTQTKLTSQGQISVPAAVRALLGLTPGASLQWTQKGDEFIVKRAVRSSTQDVHQALFPDGTSPAKTSADIKQGIRQHMKRRHAGG
jgi:antitoxin PrlF